MRYPEMIIHPYFISSSSCTALEFSRPIWHEVLSTLRRLVTIIIIKGFLRPPWTRPPTNGDLAGAPPRWWQLQGLGKWKLVSFRANKARDFSYPFLSFFSYPTWGHVHAFLLTTDQFFLSLSPFFFSGK